jgi:hypothetical protein
LALGTPLKAFIRHESSTDASYILVVFRPSHNVVASQNIIIDWEPSEANVVVKNNGVWHAILVTPNILLGVLV